MRSYNYTASWCVLDKMVTIILLLIITTTKIKTSHCVSVSWDVSTCNYSRWLYIRHKSAQRLRRQFIEPLIGSVYQRIILTTWSVYQRIILTTWHSKRKRTRFCIQVVLYLRPFQLSRLLLSTREVWRLWSLSCHLDANRNYTGKLREGINYQNAELVHVNSRSLFAIDSQLAELISSTPKHRISHPFHHPGCKLV